MFDESNNIPLNKKTISKKKKVKKRHNKLINTLESVDVVPIKKNNYESIVPVITDNTEVAMPALEAEVHNEDKIHEEPDPPKDLIINKKDIPATDRAVKLTDHPSSKNYIVPQIFSFQENVDFVEGEYFVKLPVLLSQINISTDITASVPSKNIKELLSVSNKVILKECNVVDNTNVLFIKGIVLDDIEYVDFSSKSLKHQLNQYLFYVTTSFEYIENQQSKNILLKNNCMSEKYNTIQEGNFITAISEHNIGEKIFYELIRNKVTETIDKKDTELKKYINIELSIRLFQNKILKVIT
jgi:hypothetical protein